MTNRCPCLWLLVAIVLLWLLLTPWPILADVCGGDCVVTRDMTEVDCE